MIDKIFDIQNKIHIAYIKEKELFDRLCNLTIKIRETNRKIKDLI